MCDWTVDETVEGAREVLAVLSQKARIYVATGAADSTESEIKRAVERVGLSQFISGYFCKANLGISKGSPEFLHAIIANLQIPANSVALVGDSLTKDIEPAAAVDIKPIWLTKSSARHVPEGTVIINSLRELCI